MNSLEKNSYQRSQDHIKLFIPGPSEVSPEVLKAQSQWMIGHRMPECAQLISGVHEKLKHVFYTKSRVLISTSSGTGLQEAAIRNCTDVNVLNCINGAFSERWHKVTKANGKKSETLEFEWGQAVKPEHVSNRLQSGHFDAITVVHNETSTGVISPIKEITEAVRSLPNGRDIMVLVDSVSGVGGARLEFDSWDLDVALTSSQKALALPPGLAFCAVSDRALKKAGTVKSRGTYFDFLDLDNYLSRGQTPATPAISLLYALEKQLETMLAEGMENRFARHLALRDRVNEWAGQAGFELFAEKGFESPTVSCIRNDLNINIGNLNHYLRDRGWIISNGYGRLKEKTFRIAHMGEISMEDMDLLLAEISTYLARTS